MREQLEQLVSSLLYEGYALYPYTPGATKNATPTPFGIVYPPAYAERSCRRTFDHLRLECVLAGGPGGRARGRRSASCRPPASATRRSSAGSSSARLPLAELRATAVGRGVRVRGRRATLRGRVRLRAEPLDEPRALRGSRACVHNTTELSSARRWSAPRRCAASLLSTHVVSRRRRGRFVSPLERDGRRRRGGRRPAERQHLPGARHARRRRGARRRRSCSPTIRGSRPRASATCSTTPRSRRRCCCTCRRSRDDEREQIAEQDPAVREMIERAERATPDAAARPARPETDRPPQLAEPGATPAAPEPGHPNPGEAELELDGVASARAARSCCARAPSATSTTGCSTGARRRSSASTSTTRTAPTSRVTVDDDPAQELFRETGRYLFFRAGELEAV